MSLLQYSEKELLGSLIVDREAHICGYIAGFKISSNRIALTTYRYETKNLEIPDEGELTRRLFEVTPRKGILKRQLTTEEFNDWIREELDIPKTEPVSVEHLVICANLRNIEVPMKTEEVKVKLEEDSIDWSYVDKVTSTDLGKCVLLKGDTKGKGAPASTPVGFQSTAEVSGKIVIDSEGKIVGYASQFLIGSPPALLINLGQDTEEQKTDAEALKRALIPSRFKNEKQLLDTVKKDLNLQSINGYRARAIAIWAKRNNIDVQENTLEHKSWAEIPVEWEKIAKINDVVFLNAPIKVIRSIQSIENPATY